MKTNISKLLGVLYYFFLDIFIKYKFTIFIILIYIILKNYNTQKNKLLLNETTLVVYLDRNHLVQSPIYIKTLTALKYAIQDKKIKEVHMNLTNVTFMMNTLSSSFSLLEELRGLIVNLSLAGKKVTAYSSNYDIISYYLASAADTIICPPYGYIHINGIFYEAKFYKDLLEKIKVPMKTFKAKGNIYKSGPEMYTEKRFTEPSKRQMQEYFDQVEIEIKNKIEQNLKQKNDKLKMEEIIYMPADMALENNIINSIQYSDEIYEPVKTPSFFELLLNPNMNLNGKLKKKKHQINITYYWDKIKVVKDTVMLFLTGQIGDGVLSSGINLEKFKNEVNHIIKKKKEIKNVIIGIDSPGGRVDIGMEMFFYLDKLRKENFNIIVLQGSMAASGGYWLSVISKHIVARNLTITGSIGVYSIQPSFYNLLEYIGITYDGIQQDRNFFGEVQKKSKKDNKMQNIYQNRIDFIYDNFKKHITDNRTLPIDFEEYGGGRVLSGTKGLEANLVDEISDYLSLLKKINKSDEVVMINIIDIKQKGGGFGTAAKILINNYQKLTYIISQIKMNTL